MSTQEPLELLKQMDITFDPQNLVYYAGNGNNYTAVELLLKAGMDVDSVGKEGTNALWNATAVGREKTMRLLISNGANVNALTAKGYTPLLTAISKKYQDKTYPALNIIRILLEAKADPEIKADGIWAMALAAKNKDNELIELLKNYGAKEITVEEAQKSSNAIDKSKKVAWVAPTIIVAIVVLCFGTCYYMGSNSSSSGSGSYASAKTHTCEWCKKQYTGAGYYHIEDQCASKDVDFDQCCSQKCCQEEWNSTHSH